MIRRLSQDVLKLTSALTDELVELDIASRSRAMRGQLTRRIRWATKAAILSRAAVLQRFALPREKAPIRFAEVSEPRVSIVVPVYNQIATTLACLRSLAETPERTSFEVIVVDDCSSDATPTELAKIPGLRVHRNVQNLGFVRGCNAGAKLARGEFLCFLNNDTLVTPGWLDELVQTFSIFPDAGLVGSKLVYPDGSLQEAGGIIFRDGTGLNYGRHDDPERPEYCYAREVDYCSGASIMIRRFR